MPTSRKPKAASVIEAAPAIKRKPKKKEEEVYREFLGPDAPFYMNNDPNLALSNCHCGLCGNTGIIDTRGKMLTPGGAPCGVRRFCICPNGRELKATHGGILIPPEFH